MSQITSVDYCSHCLRLFLLITLSQCGYWFLQYQLFTLSQCLRLFLLITLSQCGLLVSTISIVDTFTVFLTIYYVLITLSQCEYFKSNDCDSDL